MEFESACRCFSNWMPCQLYSNIFWIVLYWWFQLLDMPPNPCNSGNLYWYAVEPCRPVLLLDWEACQANQWFTFIYKVFEVFARWQRLRRLYFFSTLCVFAVSSGLKASKIFSYSKLFLTSFGPQAGELWRSSHTSFLHGGRTKRWGWAGMEVGEW